MKFLLLIVNSEEDWQRLKPAEQQAVIDRMNQFDAELKTAGKFFSCGGLAPSCDAKTVRLTGQQRTVVDGPAFRMPDSNHVVTGFFVIEAATTAEAITWAEKMPIISGGVEVRPIAME